MAIEFRCSQCNQLLRVSEASAGKNARCPKCQTLMTVPAGGGAAAAAPLPPLSSAPASGFAPTPQPSAPPPPFAPAASGDVKDPFAFLDTTSGGSAPPPAPPAQAAGNPFGDAQLPSPFGGPAVGNINPYASPSAYAGYQPTTKAAGERIGLPWENKAAGPAAWWETAQLVMTQTNYAFSIMRQYGGLGNPMLFALWGQGIGFLAGLIWVVIFVGIAAIASGGNQGMEALLFQLVFQLVFGAFGVVLNATVVPLIGAAIQHLALKMVGGANQRYETSFRVVAFVQGSFAWLQIIPICGPLVMVIWTIVAGIIGMAHAHECSMGKAVGAFFISLVIGCAIGLVIYLGIIGVVVAVVGAAGLGR